jgi:hypothetical protein
MQAMSCSIILAICSGNFFFQFHISNVIYLSFLYDTVCVFRRLDLNGLFCGGFFLGTSLTLGALSSVS